MKRACYGVIIILFLVIATNEQSLAEVSPSGGPGIETGPMSHFTPGS